MNGKFECIDNYGKTIGICQYLPNQKHKIYDLFNGIFEYISCNHQIHEYNHSSSVLLSSES